MPEIESGRDVAVTDVDESQLSEAEINAVAGGGLALSMMEMSIAFLVRHLIER